MRTELKKEEKILLITRQHWLKLLLPIFVWMLAAALLIWLVDETGFFSRYSKESPLDKINNVEYDQSVWGRLFGYGNVDIQTAAEMGETTYEMIHHPKLLKDTITHAQEEYKKAKIANQATQLARAIAAN